MAELTVPTLDFSALGNLGQDYKKAQADQVRQQTLAQLGQGGTLDPQALVKAGIGINDINLANLGVGMQNHQDALTHQTAEDTRAASNDAFSHNIQTQQLAIAQRAAARADEGVPEKAADRAKAAAQYGITPDMPEFNRFVLTGELPTDTGKPIPYETLSGTKFLVKQPNGSYVQVDPQAIGQPQPQPTAPQPVQAPSPVVTPGPAVAGPSGTPVAQPQPSIAGAGGPPVIPSAVPNSPPVATAVPTGGPPVAPVATAPPPVPAAPATPQGDINAIDPQTSRRENWLKSQPPDVQAYIKKVADYEIDPRTSSIKGGHREQIMSAVAQYDPTYNQNMFGERAKAVKDFGTGAQGNSIRAFDVATDHLDTLQKYVGALKNGDIPLLNKISNAWQQETGSSLPTNVQAVAPIVGAEVSKAIIGSNNALADREELRLPLQNSRSPAQLNDAIQAYKALMTGQLKGLKKQYEDTTGLKNFDSRIRDNTRAVLLGGEGSGRAGSPPPPQIGQAVGGFRFKGGNPADPASWVQSQ